MDRDEMHSSWVDRILNVLPYVFLASAVIFFIAPRSIWPGFYSPIFFGLASLASAVCLVAPEYWLHPADKCQRNSLRAIRSALAIAFTLNGLGEVYLYQLYKFGFQYDKLLHLTVPFLFLVALTSFLQAWRQQLLRSAIWKSFAIVLVFAVLWEIFEYLSDAIFKTSEFGIYGKLIFWDTSWDLLSDLLSAAIAVTCLHIPKFYNMAVLGYCQGNLTNDRNSETI